MLAANFPIDALTQLSQRTRERMLADRPELIRRVGGRLRALVVESFERRSTGQPDAGITWAPLSERYLRSKKRRGLSDRIGIATGRLAESVEVSEEDRRVHVAFTADYAFAFNQERPLVPDQLPSDWEKALEKTAVEWADQILVTHLEDEVPF